MEGKKPLEECGLEDRGKVLTFIVIAVWIIVFLGGILVDSSPYRTQIASGQGGLLSWLIVLLVYTPTNIAMLSLLMGLLGALGRCATLSADKESSKESERDTINPFLSGVIRGFIVYLLTISGLLVVLAEPTLSPTGPEPYIRLASIISIVSFIVGYNPKYFGKLLNRASQGIKTKRGKADDSQPDA
jgi:hypothetical protein